MTESLLSLLPGSTFPSLIGVLRQFPSLWLFLVLVLLEEGYLLVVALALVLARKSLRVRRGAGAARAIATPTVSCIITCYSEGALVQRTIASLLEQDYGGAIEILPVIDGARRNVATLAAALAMQAETSRFSGRCLRILPKWVRGGRASSLNAGLAVASGSIVLALDGDTSFDRDMISRLLRHFARPGVVAVAGTLRVRNAGRNLLTRLQGLDYLLFRQFVRAGLGVTNTVNNIPGAHGSFRIDVLRALGGWDNGSAEDVDLAHRLKCCFGQRPEWRIAVAPDVISHTDVPERCRDFLHQRLRWEGDPVYLFLRKHGRWMRPGLMGWRNYLFAVWYGLIFQILMPLLMLLAVAILFVSPVSAAATVLAAGYVTYLAVATILFGLHLWLTSDRPRKDLAAAPLLPLYPAFIFALRAWSGIAVGYSLVAHTHRDSSMAPWWVLRKGRF